MPNVLVEEEHSLSNGYTRNLDLAVGGQQGALSEPKKWVSSATYVRQKLIAVLIEAPGHMQYMDHGTDRIAMLKSLIELMPTSVTGLTSKLDVSYGEHKISNAGELHHTMTGVTRSPSVPVFEWPEKEGKAIFNFWNQYIIELLADPETGHPGLVNKEAYINAKYPEFLPDAVSFTVLFIEPSKDLSKVTSAWLTTNMQPKTTGDDEGKRVIGEANELNTINVEFTGTTMIGESVLKLAQDYMDNLNEKGFAPQALPGFFDAVSSEVEAGAEDYAKKAAAVAEAVQT